MNDQKLKSLLGKLWDNWAFRLSLSSNELFHSNILQFIAESLSSSEQTSPSSGTGKPFEESDFELNSAGDQPVADAVITVGGRMVEPGVITVDAATQLLKLVAGDSVESHKLFKPVFDKLRAMNQTQQLVVAREARNMDLAVLFREPSTKRQGPLRALFALEVKVKAFPERSQLEVYLNSLKDTWKGSDYSPPLFLLTGMGAEKATREKEATGQSALLVTTLNFSELKLRLEAHKFNKSEKPVQAEYSELCGLLHQLFITLQGELRETLTINRALELGNQLVPYRVHAIWWKQWAAFVANKCSVRDANKDYFHTYSGYTRTGNLGACWRWQSTPNGEKAQESINIGVQIEGRSLRLFLNIVHKDLGTKGEARLNTEKIFLSLIATQGIFADNPHIKALRSAWTEVDSKEFHNGSLLAKFKVDLIEGQAYEPDIFESADMHPPKNLPRLGKSRPLFPGYGNAAHNGHSDIRLRIKPETTVNQIAGVVSRILEDGFYSDKSKAKHGLIGVVKAFQENSAQWMALHLPKEVSTPAEN